MNTFLKLVSVNIEGDKHLDRVTSLLKKEDADVVCIQEAIEENIELLKSNIYTNHVYAPMLLMNRPPAMPRKGLLVLAKQTPVQESVEYYVGDLNHIPLFEGDPTLENRALVSVTIEKDNVSYSIAETHFTWSSGGKTTQLQQQHFERLKQLLQNKKNLILCGDFNAPRGKEIFSELSIMYKDNIPASIVSTIDPVFHRNKNIMLVVDGLFTSSHYQIMEIQIVEGISDHKAIVATITAVY